MSAGQAASLRGLPTVPAPAEGPRAHVMALSSGKGGVGKSSIAASLGVALASRGRRTLLVDADLGLASLDLALGVHPTRTMLDVIRDGIDPGRAIAGGPRGVHLLPAAAARADMASLGSLDRARVRETIESLAMQYDYVLVDTGAGIGPTSMDLAAAADEVLVVVTPDITSIRHAYAALKTLALRGATRFQLVLNQVETGHDAYRIGAQLTDLTRRFLDLPLPTLAIIPRDASVPAGLAASTPFIVRTPNAAASRALLALTEAVDARDSC